MIIYSKFNIGQQVRHKLLNFLGVIIDIDPIYSLKNKFKFNNKIYKKNKIFKKYPWYHVITEDNNGNPIYTYISEIQLSLEIQKIHPEQLSLDKLSILIKKQLKYYKFKN